jgi:thiamine pyrophosphokinase
VLYVNVDSVTTPEPTVYVKSSVTPSFTDEDATTDVSESRDLIAELFEQPEVSGVIDVCFLCSNHTRSDFIASSVSHIMRTRLF